MSKIKKFLISLLILGCGDLDYANRYSMEIDEPLQGVYNQFLEDYEFYVGEPFEPKKYFQIRLSKKGDMYFIKRPWLIGTCEPQKARIVLKRSLLEGKTSGDYSTLYIILLHEIGHCFFKLPHSKNIRVMRERLDPEYYEEDIEQFFNEVIKNER